MTRVKICGLMSVEQALMAAEAGADAIGLVFYPKSPRCISIATAKAICLALPPFVHTVGLFVNQDAEAVREVLAEVPLDRLQFHGEEPQNFCNQFGRPFIKTFRVQSVFDLDSMIRDYPLASGFLLDAYDAKQYGGSGKVFNWDLFPKDSAKPLILAGGITPLNVPEAIRQCSPYAIDTSSGVETAPGVKSQEKIQQLMARVRETRSE